MDHACAKRLRLLVHRAGLVQHGIKRPINLCLKYICMVQHPHKPILYCVAVKAFDDVYDSQSEIAVLDDSAE